MSPTVHSRFKTDCFVKVHGDVSLMEFRQSNASVPFLVLPGIFQPDEWTLLTVHAALYSLQHAPGLREIHEIGSGSGVIPLILTRMHSGLALRFTCLDIKPDAGRNLDLNFRIFGNPTARPDFYCRDVQSATAPAGGNEKPDLVIANIPQLPAPEENAGDLPFNPDDYHLPSPDDADDPVRAFGLGMLEDVLLKIRGNHGGNFYAAFCRSSRVPTEVFQLFLQRITGIAVHQGDWHEVPDESTPFDQLATAEERFGLDGIYLLDGQQLSAQTLRAIKPKRGKVRISLRSCLVQIG